MSCRYERWNKDKQQLWNGNEFQLQILRQEIIINEENTERRTIALNFKGTNRLPTTFILAIPGYISTSQRGQFPVGLIAQLIEHCTGIAEVLLGFKSRSNLNFFLGFNFVAAKVESITAMTWSIMSS